ncbi:hypothetical protein CUMW_092070 [Citrus unshiu]|nr:hypothetical protein CUMW_092070 [Citrus unshiu]
MESATCKITHPQ